MQDKLILGVDENNFSPSLAADCIVCVYVQLGEKVPEVSDSKKIPKSKQRELFAELKKEGLYTIVPASMGMIDHIGIYASRNFAIISALQLMKNTLRYLGHEEELAAYIDGYWSKEWVERFTQDTKMECRGIVSGDSKVYQIGAASIIGRVYADSLFEGWNIFWPGYSLNSNHGSPDVRMYEGLNTLGIAPVFRVKGYAPKWWERILKRGENSAV